MKSVTRALTQAMAVVLTVATVAPPLAFADDASGSATAQELFNEAIALMKENKFAEACPKLAASQRADPGGGTLFALARCYEKNGQTASAWAKYQEAASALRDANSHPDWEANARASFQALAPTLSRLTIRVPAETDLPDLVVTRDGAAVDRAEWGSAVPIDPGPHAVAVSAPKRAPWTKSVDVGADRANVELVVPPLTPDAAPPPTATIVTPPPPTALATTTAQPPPLPPRTGSGQRTAGIVIMGIGGAAAIVGSVFGLLAMSAHNEALNQCNDANRCSQAGLDKDQSARSQAAASTGVFIGATALLAGGAILYLTAPSNNPSGGGVALQVAPTSGGAGLFMRGAW